MTKKIIIIGSGARECGILMKMKQSYQAQMYDFITLGTNANPYQCIHSIFIKLDSYDYNSITSQPIFNDSSNIHMVIIGPEAPIVSGVEYYFKHLGIFTLAPSKEASVIESSKIFARRLLDETDKLFKYNPIFGDLKHTLNNTFTVSNFGERIIKFKEINGVDIVIKKDGLCGGAGVYVEGDHFSIDLQDKNKFLNSELLNELLEYLKIEGNDILLEEKLEGIEFSLMSLVDETENLVHFEPIFDYKRLEEDNLGPNTGSMGSVLLNKSTLYKFLDNSIINEAQIVNCETIKALNRKNSCKYKGVLYGSYMLCPGNKLKVIEFNCRFGDPEGVLALNSIKNDLIDVFDHIKTNTLSTVELEYKNKNIVGIYCVPYDYGFKNRNPDKYDIYFRNKMDIINTNMLKNKFSDELAIIYGACDMIQNHIYTSKSRTILVLSSDDYLYKAINCVYRNIDDVVSRLKYRTDIGSKFIFYL